MRKIVIASGIIFVLFIIVFVLAILNLNFFINSNKDFFVTQIEESIGRKITVGEINTGFKEGLGIRLKNFSLADDKSFSDSEFIRASDLQVNVEFIPLLSKKINISKLILGNPRINIIKNNKGQYNFATLGSTKDPGTERTPEKQNKEDKLSLLASSIIIKEGQINYIDDQNNSEFQVQQINLRIKDLGLDKKVQMELDAAILASEPNISINGVFGPLNAESDFLGIPANGSFEVSELNINTLKKFIPVIKDYLPGGLDISGPLHAKLKFSGTPDQIMLSNINMDASVFGASIPNLELSGDIGPIGKDIENFSLDTKFNLRKANLNKLRKFELIKDSFPNSLSTQGTLDISGAIKGTPGNLEFKSAKLDATSSRFAVIGKFLKPKNTPFVITAGGRISDTIIELTNSNVTLNTLKLNTRGKINRGTTNLMNLSLRSNKIDLADLKETFPSIKEYNPSGQLELLQTSLKGELGKGQAPEIDGTLQLKNVTVYPPSFPKPTSNINTTIQFTGKSAEINRMSLNLGKSSLNISANIDKFSPLILSYNITSPELYISDINKNKSQSGETEVLKQFSSDGRVSRKHDSLSVTGNLSSSEAILSDYKLQNLETKFNILGETLKIEDFSVNTYEGLIKGKASYGFGLDPTFSILSSVRGLNLKDFLASRNSENAEKIRGKANLDINIFGNGTNWSEIKSTLKGTAKAEITDGAVLDINIADDVLKGVTGVPGLTFFVSPRTKTKYPQVFKAQDTEFEEFKASFIIEKGILETGDLKIISKDYTINGKGWMNLDGKLNLKSLFILSQEFSYDLEIDIPDLKYITNTNRRVEIPFVITGTLPKARVKPDISYLAKLVQRTGIRTVIDELSSDSEEPEEQNTQAESEPAPKKKKKRLDEKIFDEIKDLF